MLINIYVNFFFDNYKHLYIKTSTQIFAVANAPQPLGQSHLKNRPKYFTLISF